MEDHRTVLASGSFPDYKHPLGSYSKFGPAPRDPVSMLRSYLLSIKLKITSITDWVSRLKECPLYAIISGFSPDDVPGIGTFYDFFRHIWNSEQKHLSVQLRHKKKKTPKGKKHGEKTPNIKSTSAARFLDFYKKHPLPDPSLSPLSLIFRLYKQQFLDVSVSHGLIQPSAISLAGDGSPIRTSARLRYKKVCSCSEMVFPTVTANVSFLNLTVISAGIPQGTAILAATISTCL